MKLWPKSRHFRWAKTSEADLSGEPANYCQQIPIRIEDLGSRVRCDSNQNPDSRFACKLMSLNLSTSIRHRSVMELRYQFGHLYWDRSGRICRDVITFQEPGWDLERIDGNACSLIRAEENIRFSFTFEKLDFQQFQTDKVATILPSSAFGAMADGLAKVVTTLFEVDHYPRIGYRCWYLFPTTDRDESEAAIRQLKILRDVSQYHAELGEISSSSVQFVVDRGKHSVRFLVQAFEQNVSIPASLEQSLRQSTRKLSKGQDKALIDKLKAEKFVRNYPSHGVLIDLDAYIEYPPYPNDLSISQFIAAADEDFQKILQQVCKG